MNTTARAPAPVSLTRSRFGAAAMAVVLTLGMLAGVDHLASSEAPAALLAQMTAPRG